MLLFSATADILVFNISIQNDQLLMKNVNYAQQESDKHNKLHSITAQYTLLPPGLPSRTIARTVSSELLGFCFPYVFVYVQCARLS